MLKKAEAAGLLRSANVDSIADRMIAQEKRVLRFSKVQRMPAWLRVRTVLKKPIDYGSLSPVAVHSIALRKLADADVRTMKECFDIFDVDHSGTIDVLEFCELINEQRSPFLEKIFLFIDKASVPSIYRPSNRNFTPISLTLLPPPPPPDVLVLHTLTSTPAAVLIDMLLCSCCRCPCGHAHTDGTRVGPQRRDRLL
jgi:hypothetical protein